MLSIINLFHEIIVYFQKGLLTLLLFGLAIEAVAILAMIRFYFKKAPPLPTLKVFPGITIIKPCYGCNDNEEENFENFFCQDYPGPIQLLFVVSNETDPIVPTIKRYLKRFPIVDAQLIISQTRKSFRRKVDALYDGHVLAKHDLILWSDSDVMVYSDYISQIAASLLEPGVSIVSTPQYDTGVHNACSAVKVLANNCDVGLYMSLMDWVLPKKKYAWGHSLAFKRSEFEAHRDEIWDIMNRFLADDQSLPYLFAHYNKKTVFKNIYCPVHCGKKTWSEMISQKKRWAVCQRLVYPHRLFYIGSLFIFPQIPAAVLVLLTGFSLKSIVIFLIVGIIKILVSFSFELLYLNSIRMTFKYFWAICIGDLMQIYFFIHAFLAKTIDFHGKRFQVVNRYFLEELDPTEAPKKVNSKWFEKGLQSVLPKN